MSQEKLRAAFEEWNKTRKVPLEFPNSGDAPTGFEGGWQAACNLRADDGDITTEMVEKALQRTWNDFVQDTNCYPDCFKIERKKLVADFSITPFAKIVASYLRLNFETWEPQATAKTTAPVEKVSLNDCAMALQGNPRIKLGSDLLQIAKAVLDAAGVVYE